MVETKTQLPHFKKVIRDYIETLFGLESSKAIKTVQLCKDVTSLLSVT